MRRFDRVREIERMDPERDYLAIYRLTATYEFPWDITRALELALYRTYAVPSIGGLLARTAELTDRTQKRYDDTVLLLDGMLEHGLDTTEGRTALRRVNRMHGHYGIGNDDMRYVLCTFVVVPRRWIDAYGWRQLTPNERAAMAVYYRTLGEHMGIREVPRIYAEFEAYMDAYEAAHFGWDEGGRRVSDATLDLVAGWYGPLGPAVRAATKALLDDSLLDAFRYARPAPSLRAAARTALRLRGRAVRFLPPRRTPHHSRRNREIRSYPGLGTRPLTAEQLGALGTFPADGPRSGRT